MEKNSAAVQLPDNLRRGLTAQKIVSLYLSGNNIGNYLVKKVIFFEKNCVYGVFPQERMCFSGILSAGSGNSDEKKFAIKFYWR